METLLVCFDNKTIRPSGCAYHLGYSCHFTLDGHIRRSWDAADIYIARLDTNRGAAWGQPEGVFIGVVVGIAVDGKKVVAVRVGSEPDPVSPPYMNSAKVTPLDSGTLAKDKNI